MLASGYVDSRIQLPGDRRSFSPFRPEAFPGRVPDVGVWGEVGLFIFGAHKRGKTRLAIHVGLGVGIPMEYWPSGKFLSDLDRKRWYERAVSNDSRNDALFAEFVDYEKEFERICFCPLLVFDELYYWPISEWAQSQVDQMLKARLDLGVSTIIVASNLPPVGTPMRAMVEHTCQVVGV